MTVSEVLEQAEKELGALKNQSLNVLNVTRPPSVEYALQLAKVISKLSSILGNTIEFSVIDQLNSFDWNNEGVWKRQDPGFPDALFKSDVVIPNPGVEIKAWFPLATEITARFKDSVTIFKENNINMALIAWLPEHVIWGKPKIVDVLLVTGKSVAEARDAHYHCPPHYLVFEPEDTSERTANLQQTNTNGYKIQKDKCDVKAAEAVVESWGSDGKQYSPSPEYQKKLRSLQADFVYRNDTNYAKIDRIKHDKIEEFKTHVFNIEYQGKTIGTWSKLLSDINKYSPKDYYTSKQREKRAKKYEKAETDLKIALESILKESSEDTASH